MPNQAVANGQTLRLESTTISDVQAIFDDKIKSLADESWVCYNSESENGLTGLSPRLKCSTAINLLLSGMPVLGEQIKEVCSFYCIKG